MNTQPNFDNQLTLLGAVVSKDNEVRYFADGTALLVLDLVHKRQWKAADGSKRESACYYQVQLTGSLAEAVGREVKPGLSLYVRGQLRQKAEGGAQYVQAERAQLVPRPGKLFWNQAYLVGTVASCEGLVSSVNNKPMLPLTLTTEYRSPGAKSAQEIPVDVKLWGYAATLTAREIEVGRTILLEGALLSKSYQEEGQYHQRYWLDAHSAILA